MEWHELGPAAEPKFGRRSQRIVCGGCDTRRNSLGCGNSLSLSPAADADRAKAAVAAELRLTRSREIDRLVSFSPLRPSMRHRFYGPVMVATVDLWTRHYAPTRAIPVLNDRFGG